jgi:hypothetical protein
VAAKARVAETTCCLLADALAWTGGAWEAVDATGRTVAFWETVWSSSRPTTAGSDVRKQRTRHHLSSAGPQRPVAPSIGGMCWGEKPRLQDSRPVLVCGGVAAGQEKKPPAGGLVSRLLGQGITARGGPGFPAEP